MLNFGAIVNALKQNIAAAVVGKDEAVKISEGVMERNVYGR